MFLKSRATSSDLFFRQAKKMLLQHMHQIITACRHGNDIGLLQICTNLRLFIDATKNLGAGVTTDTIVFRRDLILAGNRPE